MSKTIIGLIMILIGFTGLGEKISQSEVTTLVDALIQVFGILMAWYGRVNVGDIHVTGVRKSTDDVTFHPV